LRHYEKVLFSTSGDSTNLGKPAKLLEDGSNPIKDGDAVTKGKLA